SISANSGTADEAIGAFLPSGGVVYLVVISAEGASGAPYTLNIQIQPGPTATAATQPGTVALNHTFDQTVRTLFIQHSTRMQSRYSTLPGQSVALTSLSNLLSPGSQILTDSHGVLIDLATDLDPAAASRLAGLYAQWDARPDQPILANATAGQIWLVIDEAIRLRYPNITDLVITGGDEVIPFYRTIDETTIGNERAYVGDLDAEGAGLNRATALGGSLFFRGLKTDNFYADRKPTPWRGRQLFVPDLGIGRLVEYPSEIVSYLQATVNDPAATRYIIQAGSANPALVTGYDFLSDSSSELADILAAAGAPVTRLIGDTWSASEFTNLWFGGQFNQIANNSAYSGLHTPYGLMALNSHFSHIEVLPADYLSSGASVFDVEPLQNATPASPGDAYFRRGGRPTLIYSVGCHSGLNASDDSFITVRYRADFASAIMRNGGNLIGNTGYGYGDDEVAGFSERLQILFTNQMLRPGQPSLGAALAQAKQRYLRDRGVTSFSVYDEKVLSEWTLYGLPYLRVDAATPQTEVEAGPLVLTPHQAHGLMTQPDPASGAPTFTRLITITTSFQLDAAGFGSILRATSVIADSMRSATTTVVGVDQAALGQPVLPALSYDLTLLPGSGPLPAEPRSVRLRQATTLPDLTNFDPYVTTPITQESRLRANDPILTVADVWLPDQPYGVQRTVSGDTATDKLLVLPAQFRATGSRTGALRRYQQMVLEITYLDPNVANDSLLNDDMPPVVNGVTMTETPTGVSISAEAYDDTTAGSYLQVEVAWTNDGSSWQTIALPYLQDRRYAQQVAITSMPREVVVTAHDASGNIAMARVPLTIHQVYLPLVRR
ncbi:hypothetical protein K2Z83_27550, partial [Oscillochloris sp. ZM17-4]|uniref:hypothetical protein n=1 Tax=Oscillochloris sp. ZM17-4 TaxID=2866714 RepID=UPI001C73D5B7